MQLTPTIVYDLVMRNRVRKAKNYHADEHGFKWLEDVIPALMGLHAVERDNRPDHPQGWKGFAAHWRGMQVRVDFDVEVVADGEILLVVTMMED